MNTFRPGWISIPEIVAKLGDTVSFINDNTS